MEQWEIDEIERRHEQECQERMNQLYHPPAHETATSPRDSDDITSNTSQSQTTAVSEQHQDASGSFVIVPDNIHSYPDAVILADDDDDDDFWKTFDWVKLAAAAMKINRDEVADTPCHLFSDSGLLSHRMADLVDSYAVLCNEIRSWGTIEAVDMLGDFNAKLKKFLKNWEDGELSALSGSSF